MDFSHLDVSCVSGAISATIRSRVLESKVLESLNASSLQFLSIRRCLRHEWCRLNRRKRRSPFELTKTNYELYKHLRTCTDFPELYDKWAYIHEVSITQWTLQPSLIFRFGTIVCVLRINTTHTKMGAQPSQLYIASTSITYWVVFPSSSSISGNNQTSGINGFIQLSVHAKPRISYISTSCDDYH